MRKIRFSNFFLIFTLLVLASHLFAQPDALWIRNYDSGASEFFFDVYAASDSGYIAVGATGQAVSLGGTWIMVKTDSEGNTIWSNQYGGGGNYCWPRSVIEADNGDFLAAGTTGRQGQVDIIRVNSEGEQQWRRQYLNGDARAIIELKNGNFLICGETQMQGFLLMIDGEGEETWNRIYPIDDQVGAYGSFSSMRETENQVVVAGEGRRIGNEPWHMWLVKADLEEEGALIWEEHYFIGNTCTCNTLISCEGGFTLSGTSGGLHLYLAKINEIGEIIWSHIYDNQVDVETGFCLANLEGGGFGIAGRALNSRDRIQMPFVLRTDENGLELGRSYHDLSEVEGFFTGVNGFYSIVIGLDNSAVAAGTVHTGGQNYDGLIMKWEEDHPGPFFVSWTPEDTLLTCLSNDSIQFAVHARHQWQEQFDKLWWITNSDTLSRDTTVTITFEEIGEYEVNCEIRDEVISAIKTWNVTVREFYLTGFQPDSSEITIRRNTQLDFILDIESIEGLDLSYFWELTGRQEEEIEGEDSVNIDFAMTGDHELTADVSAGETVEQVSWDIHVRSSLWSWQPVELILEVPNDTLIDFAVFPFNEESDSLQYIWKLNGETISDSNEESLSFREIGGHEVQALLWDGADVDSVLWTVTSYERNEVKSLSHNELPERVELYAPVPNPFNSSTKITFSIPLAQQINLTIFDIKGRKVADLISERKLSGKREIVLNSERLSTGIYFISLASAKEHKTRKLVLIK